MNFKKYSILILVALLTSCNNNPFKSSDSDGEEMSDSSTYATVYANNQTVYIYGYINQEAFDLTSIKTGKIIDGNIIYKASNSNIEIKDNKVNFKKVGTSIIEVTNEDETASLKYVVVINKDKDSIYNYPYDLELDMYSLESGNIHDVTVDDGKLTLNSTTTWTRVTYDLGDNFNNNYIIEADFTINSTYNNDTSRWAGLIFKDNETDLKKYPFYQFGFRQNMSTSSGIELSKFYGMQGSNYSYTYLYQGKNSYESNIKIGEKNHVLLYVNENTVKGYINNNLVVDKSLTDTSTGRFGFQSGGCNITFENINVSFKNDTLECSKVLPSSDEANTRIDITTKSMMPNIIASGNDDLDINSYGSQYYFIAKKEDGNISLYDIDNNLTDLSLEYMLMWYKEDMICNLEVEDKSSLTLVSEIIKANNLEDFNIWSKSTELLTKAHELLPKARLGYIASENEDVSTSENVGKVAHKAGASNAYLVMVDVNKLSKDIVTYFTLRGYTAVANASNGNVMQAALDGCSLIVTKVSSKASSDIAILNSLAAKSLLYKPVATGHRGVGTNGETFVGSGLCENTLSSYDKAFELGADAIEIDVHTCKVDPSNKNACNLAVIHDETTAGVSKTSLKVSTSTITQLKALTLNNSTDHIPSLDEVFERYSGETYKDKTIVLEVKDNSYNTGVAAVELAKKYNWDTRIVLIVFNDSTCEQLHNKYPEIPVAYLGTVYRTDSDTYWDSITTYINNGVNLSSQWSTVDEYAMKQSNARGILCWLWTYNRGNNSYLTSGITGGNKCFTTNNLPSFSNNVYKLDTKTSINLTKNQTTTIEANEVTYTSTNKTTDFEVVLVSGKASINGTKVTKLDDSEVQVFLRKKVTWEDSLSKDVILKDYYIYSELITIK